MPLTTPNAQDSPTYQAQAVIDKTDISALSSIAQQYGVVSGCTVSAGGGYNVSVAAGVILVGGAQINVSAVTGLAPAAASSTDRRDIVVVSSTGAVTMVTGTPTAETAIPWTNTSIYNPPVKPSVPAGSVLLAEVYIPGGGGTVLSSWITDKTLTNTNLATPVSGNLTIIGHSWMVGISGLPIATEARGSIASRLMGMLGTNSNNTNNLATGGSSLSHAFRQQVLGISAAIGGWASTFQWVFPLQSANYAEAGWTVGPQSPVTGGNGPAVIVHGINDVWINPLSMPTQGLTAYANALISVLSRLNAGALYTATYPAGTLTWDTNVFSAFTGTWAGFTAALLNYACSGAGVKLSSTNGDNFTIQIPTNFNPGPSGQVCAITLIGKETGYTTLDTAIASNATTTLVVGASPQFGGVTSEFPASGFVIQVLTEQMLVTAGGTGTSWTVTRGVNGTSALASIPRGTPITHAATGKVNWTTSGSNASITGSTFFTGQSYGGVTGPITTRFLLTSADAGKTITGTIAGIVASDTVSNCVVDSVAFEAIEPVPTAVLNVPPYAYTNFTGISTVPASTLTSLNSTMSAVVAGTGAGAVLPGTHGFAPAVQIADAASVHSVRNGTTNAVHATGDTSIAVVPNSTSAWSVGIGDRITVNSGFSTTLTNATGVSSGATAITVANADAIGAANFYMMVQATSEIIKVTAGNGTTSWTIARAQLGTAAAAIPYGALLGTITEDMLVTGTSGSNPVTLTVTRGINGSTACPIGNGAIVADAGWWHTDNLHPNGYGHAVMAKLLYSSLQAASNSLASHPYDFAATSSNWVQKTFGRSLGTPTNTYLGPPVSGTAATAGASPALNTLSGHHFNINRLCTLSQIGINVTAGGAGSSYRFGIYLLDNDNAYPNTLLLDAGTAVTTGTGFVFVSTYKLLQPGDYFVVAVPQGGSKPTVTTIAANGWGGPALPAPIAATATIPVGYTSGTSTPGALPSSFGAITASTSGIPVIWLNLQSKTWN